MSTRTIDFFFVRWLRCGICKRLHACADLRLGFAYQGLGQSMAYLMQVLFHNNNKNNSPTCTNSKTNRTSTWQMKTCTSRISNRIMRVPFADANCANSIISWPNYSVESYSKDIFCQLFLQFGTSYRFWPLRPFNI